MSNMNKRYSAQEIMTFRKATGLGMLDAKNFLIEHPQTLGDKIFLAYKLQQERIKQGLPTKTYLYDPIEDDARYTEIFKEVKQKIQMVIENSKENQDFFSRMIMMSSLQRAAVITKNYLLERYNIQYFSIIEMNPRTIFN